MQYISPATEQQNWVCCISLHRDGYNPNKHCYIITWIRFKDVARYVGSEREITICSSQSVCCHTYSKCNWCAQREGFPVSFTQARVDWYHTDVTLWMHTPEAQGYTWISKINHSLFHKKKKSHVNFILLYFISLKILVLKKTNRKSAPHKVRRRINAYYDSVHRPSPNIIHVKHLLCQVRCTRMKHGLIILR